MLGSVALLLTALLTGCGALVSDPADPAADPATNPATDPPAGDVRWVGARGVAVAVPDWWTTGETRCLKPVETTVYAESGAMTDCAEPEPTDAELDEVSSLAVIDLTSGLGQALVARMRPAGEVDGREVLELEGCDPQLPGRCRRVFAVPSEDVAFGVVIADSGDGSHRAIRESLRVLPDGTTTVPIAWDDDLWVTPSYGSPPEVVGRYQRALEAAGLEVRVEVAPLPGEGDVAGGTVSDLPPGSLLGVEPQPGTPVDLGSVVTVTVMPDLG